MSVTNLALESESTDIKVQVQSWRFEQHRFESQNCCGLMFLFQFLKEKMANLELTVNVKSRLATEKR